MSSSLGKQASRHLIQSDLRFSMAVLRAVVANRDRDDTTSWLALSHLHYLSLVAYEVRNFLKLEGATSEPWVHGLALAASRHSNKLFNDTKRTQLELLAEFANGADRDRAWFLQNNRAPWLFRALSKLGVLVNDTSVVLYDMQILCTSHSISFHAGLHPHAKGAETVERAREIAAYLSELGGTEGDSWAGDDYFRGWRSHLVAPKDARYENLYAAMFPKVPRAEAIALAILQSDLVVLQLMRELVPVADELAPATFKFRFVGVWQIVETLKTVGAPGSDLALSDTMRANLEAILSGQQLELMGTKGARALRNVLVHYGLGSIDPVGLNWQDPVLGLPQLLLNGVDWLTVDHMLDEQIAVLLAMFTAWTGPFAQALKEPH